MEMRNAFQLSVGKPGGMRSLKYLRVDGRVTLNCS
jgi:hypothetical protein